MTGKKTILAAKACRLAAAIAGLAALAAVTVPAAAQTFTMKIGNATRNDVQHEWQNRLKELVEERSKGRIKASVYPSSQLGSIPRMIEGVQLGTIEAWVGPGEFIAAVAPGFQIVGVPGLFKDTEHAYRVTQDEKFRKAFLALGEDKGVIGISLFIYGPTSFVSREPIEKLEDFRNKKVRVFGSPIQTEPFSALGGAPVPMPLGDVLPALQRRVIDGVLSALNVFTAFRYYDVSKNLTQTHYSMTISAGIVSKRWFSSLPKDLRDIITTAGKELEPEMYKWATNAIKQAEKTWTEHGGKLIQLPDDDWNRMMTTLNKSAVGVISKDPELSEIYAVLEDAAKRTE